MPKIEKTKAIVLHSLKYNDSSMIVHCYTEVYGKKSFILSNVRGKKSKNKVNLIQPLFLVDILFYDKAGRSIHNIKEIYPFYTHKTLPYNILKSSLAMFIAEIIHKSISEEEKNISLFTFLISSIHLLDETENGLGNFHLVFLCNLSKFLGMYPKNNFDERNKIFNMNEGLFVEFRPSNLYFMDKDLSYTFHQILNISFADISKIEIYGRQKQLLLSKVIEYYKLHLLNLKTINSLEILQDVFE